MDYKIRTTLIFRFLTDSSEGLLTRYRRPDHLSDDAARGEINDAVEDLNSLMPNCDQFQFQEILVRFKVKLRQSVSSRFWPTIRYLTKPSKFTLYSDEELIAEFRKLAEELGIDLAKSNAL